MTISPLAAVGIAAELASNDKVRNLALTAFNGVYDRIFNKKTVTTVDALVGPPQPSERALLNQILESQPSSTEMSIAFSALQGELRRGQQRLWFGLAGVGALNTVLLLVLLFR